MYRLSVGILLLRPNSYADAKSWENLVYAFTETLRNSPLDEIILLLHNNIPGPQGWRSKYVRPVSYGRLDEIPKLVLSTPAPGALRIIAFPQRSHIEGEKGAQPDDDRDGQEQQKCIDVPQESIAEGKGVGVAENHEEEIDETGVNAAKTIQDVYRRYLERKRANAAKKIQAAYRRHLKRNSIVRQGIDAVQAHYWRLLHKKSAELEWSKNSRYYLLFRVPLAYILVCLDAIKVFVESEKKEAKKRVMTEDDKDLEELMDALNQHRCDSIDCTSYRGLMNSTVNSSRKRSHSRRNSPHPQNSTRNGL